MADMHDAPEWFRSCIRSGEELSESVGVVLVANVKERTTPADDYDEDSIITEFLSATELDDIVAYFEAARFYCEVVVDEQNFLEWIGGRRTRFPRKRTFVYNLAQNGTGPGRLALIAGLCRLHGLLLLDSDAYGVTIAHHKFHALSLLAQFGVPIARCWSFSHLGWWPEIPGEGTRLIAKPTYESASIGIHHDSVFTMGPDAEEHLLRRLTAYRQPLTIQEFVPGFEVEVPVFEDNRPRTLAAIGISLGGKRCLDDQILTYERVFRDGYGFYNFADQDKSCAREAMAIAEMAFRTLDLSGIGRVDFRVTEGGQPLVIEVNCKPHITKHSSFSVALGAAGCSGVDLAKFLVGAAVERHALNAQAADQNCMSLNRKPRP
jgi:D-alanine-D-alanine ligase